MIYILTGTDPLAKDKTIADIKSKLFKKKEAEQFDYEALDGHRVSAENLKKALIALPAVAKKRLVLIRKVNKLSNQNKDLVLGFADQKESQIELILDWEEGNPKNAFFNKLKSAGKVLTHTYAEPTNVFDMTNCMARGNSSGALKILSQLIEEGNHPLKIMAPLVWFWGKRKNQLPADRFKKGLLELQEADLNIKRSRLDPNYTIEVLVVKLCSLIA